MQATGLHNRLFLIAPLLISASCTFLFSETQGTSDGGSPAIDAASSVDAAAGDPVSCTDVMNADAIGFNTSVASLADAPEGMTGMVVANDLLYLVDIGASGSGTAPKIWTTQNLSNWADAATLGDVRKVEGPINVGAARIEFNLNEVSAPIAFAPNLGQQGSLLLVHEQSTAEAALRRQIARYDFLTDTWSLVTPASSEVRISHSLSVLGDYVYGIQHAGGDPIVRVDLSGGAPGTVDFTRSTNLVGSDPQWMSRAAQITAGNGTIYAIKNDWCTISSPTGPGDSCAVTGQRLFSFNPVDFKSMGSTSVDLSVPLPFEVGHGSTLVYVPPGWAQRVGPQGALFMTNGRAPSGHEGLSGNAGNQYALYDIACDHWLTGSLPTPSGSGSSAVFFNQMIVVHPGGMPDQSTANAALWVASGT